MELSPIYFPFHNGTDRCHPYCLETLRGLAADSVDLICTDPPYGYSFMGKAWDKAVPSVDVWRECLRVLKPGAFAFVMSAPRQDVLSQMIVRIGEAGFDTDFTSIYWTYASGFPKAANIGKMVDRRLGAEREVVGVNPNKRKAHKRSGMGFDAAVGKGKLEEMNITRATSPNATALDGSYGGFQPKPAVEVIIVAMKPLSEKTFVDQALKNRKGVTWLDDARIPGLVTTNPLVRNAAGFQSDGLANQGPTGKGRVSEGRFPANLLVSDVVLHDNSRYFSLDAWADKLPDRMRATYPFFFAPKASKGEKGPDCNHPTVKPLQLMAYLVTLGSRPGDTVLDPYLGSGTTALAAKLLGREWIGIERQAEYVEIAKTRVEAIRALPIVA